MNRSYLAQKSDKIEQENEINVHQSHNNTPFVQNKTVDKEYNQSYHQNNQSYY